MKRIKMLLVRIWTFLCLLNEKTLEAQYTIYALFMTVLTLIAYVACYPVLSQVLSEADISGIEGTILSWIPLFILLFILWSAIWYVQPRQHK